MHKSHHVVISSELPCIFPFSTSSRPIQPNLFKRFKSEEDVPKLEPVKHCSELWTAMLHGYGHGHGHGDTAIFEK